FALMLSGIILSAAFGFQTVRAETGVDARIAQQARVSVLKLGTGERARVEVKLRDETKLKGYISAAGADSFTVTDARTGAATVVAYTDVAQVKKSGNGFSTMTKVLIGGAVAAGVIIGWQVVKPALCDGGAQSRGPC
ncbi:MAG TPA: hypothetical protein VIQ24_19605, partial [Pyrinomonadaceae bacterium]